MSSPFFIGVDLGGSQIKAVAVDPTGEILGEIHARTDDSRAANAASVWTGRVKEVIAELSHRAQGYPAGIGVAAPGLAAGNGRSIASMPGRMHGLEHLDWTTFLESPSAIPVLNDAHAALLGEAWLGAAKGCSDALLLTLGTGVGGAVLANGKLLLGHIGRAGHAGHICLEPDAPPDDTGAPGSLELAIGDLTVARRTEGRFRTTRELFEAHRQGDREATRVWHRSIYLLACGLVSLINVVDPEKVIIGGGIAQAGAELLQPLDEQLRRMEWQPGGQRVRVVPAELGKIGGAIGAAWQAMQLVPVA